MAMEMPPPRPALAAPAVDLGRVVQRALVDAAVAVPEAAARHADADLARARAAVAIVGAEGQVVHAAVAIRAALRAQAHALADADAQRVRLDRAAHDRLDRLVLEDGVHH